MYVYKQILLHVTHIGFINCQVHVKFNSKFPQYEPQNDRLLTKCRTLCKSVDIATYRIAFTFVFEVFCLIYAEISLIFAVLKLIFMLLLRDASHYLERSLDVAIYINVKKIKKEEIVRCLPEMIGVNKLLIGNMHGSRGRPLLKV